MQYEIIAVTPHGERKLLDRRHDRPSYAHFDLVKPGEPVRVIAPNLASAKQYRDDFLAWNNDRTPDGLGFDVSRVVLRKYVPPQTEVVP
jgi:hypothetical protein